MLKIHTVLSAEDAVPRVLLSPRLLAALSPRSWGIRHLWPLWVPALIDSHVHVHMHTHKSNKNKSFLKIFLKANLFFFKTQ